MSDPVKHAERAIVWVAQGFGIGRVPKAPGTWGSLLGIAWTALLLLPQTLPVYLLGSACGVLLSVWLCGRAERILQQHDPGSIVLDEIIALPFCFLPWVLWKLQSGGSFPSPMELLTYWNGGLCLTGFALFRVFDIWKPWPVRQSQRFAGGLGVTLDDLLASVYAALALAGLLWWVG